MKKNIICLFISFGMIAGCSDSKFTGTGESRPPPQQNANVEPREPQKNVQAGENQQINREPHAQFGEGQLDELAGGSGEDNLVIPGTPTRSVAVNIELFPTGGDYDYDDVTFCFTASEENIYLDGQRMYAGTDFSLNVAVAVNSNGLKRVKVFVANKEVKRYDWPDRPYFHQANLTLDLKKGQEIKVVGSYGSVDPEAASYPSDVVHPNVRVQAQCNN